MALIKASSRLMNMQVFLMVLSSAAIVAGGFLLGAARAIDIHEVQSFELLERNQIIMGTTARLVLPSQFANLHNAGFSLLQQIDAELSTYKNESAVSILNRNGVIDNPPPSLLEVLRLSREAYQDTQGYFDVSIGSATLDFYHFDQLNTKYPEQAAIPDQSTPEKWASLLRSRGSFADIDFSTHQVKFLREGLKLDFGGIGKGYAIDKVTDLVKKLGVRVGRMGLSGDIRCLGSCVVMIEDPRTSNSATDARPLAVLYSKDDEMVFSTSGVSYRYLRTKEVNHLLDPHTLKPQQNILSVTLFGRVSGAETIESKRLSKEAASARSNYSEATGANLSNAKLDAYTTAVAVMPKEKALSWLAQHSELGYVIVFADARVQVSSNLKKFLDFFLIGSAE